MLETCDYKNNANAKQLEEKCTVLNKNCNSIKQKCNTIRSKLLDLGKQFTSTTCSNKKYLHIIINNPIIVLCKNNVQNVNNAKRTTNQTLQTVVCMDDNYIGFATK